MVLMVGSHAIYGLPQKILLTIFSELGILPSGLNSLQGAWEAEIIELSDYGANCFFRSSSLLIVTPITVPQSTRSPTWGV